MTNRFKDFGAGSTSVDSAPLSFKLHGEEFVCKPAIQGKFLLALVADSSSNDPDRSSRVVTDFFQKILVKDSAERFDALLKSDDKIVTVDTLAEITEWLMEVYTERPNQQPEASSTGQ